MAIVPELFHLFGISVGSITELFRFSGVHLVKRGCKLSVKKFFVGGGGGEGVGITILVPAPHTVTCKKSEILARGISATLYPRFPPLPK